MLGPSLGMQKIGSIPLGENQCEKHKKSRFLWVFGRVFFNCQTFNEML